MQVRFGMVICMVKCSLPALGSDLLQMPPILHNMFEPSKHNPKVTLSFVMPLKLSLDVIATILTLVLYAKEQEPCSRQPTCPWFVYWIGVCPGPPGCGSWQDGVLHEESVMASVCPLCSKSNPNLKKCFIFSW